MLRVALPLLLLASASCRDAASLGASSGRVCAGNVIGADVSFIRRGFCPGTSLSLAFAPSVLPGCSAPLGQWDAMISTTDGTRPAAMQAFQCAPLRIVQPLEHDALSSYQFPGGGRLRNAVYSVARTDGEPMCGERDVTAFSVAFVSLMDDDSVEVRVLAGNGSGIVNDVDGTITVSDASCTDAEASVPRDLFGVFSLSCR